MYKKYINVVTMITKEAKLTPIFIIWDNGVKYHIDKVKEIRPAASKLGGCGILYRCMIEGKERNLFYEVNRWFIESARP